MSCEQDRKIFIVKAKPVFDEKGSILGVSTDDAGLDFLSRDGVVVVCYDPKSMGADIKKPFVPFLTDVNMTGL